MEGLIALDRTDGAPLHRQVTELLRAAILDGRLPAGARLPSTRALAASVGVSRQVVVAAYDDLFAEGYVEGRHGSGTYVVDALLPVDDGAAAIETTDPPATPRWLRADGPAEAGSWIPNLPPGAIEFRPGKPSVEPLPASAWHAVWREVAAQAPPGDYGPPSGEPALREAIARYLGWARGVRRAPEEVVITTGAVQAIDLIARATLRPGDPVGFEEPGPWAARNIVRGHGARVVPVPVDEDGLCVDLLPRGEAAPAVVYVTPSHQYPLGGRLPIARRRALLAWAREHDSLIVEDDYDSEYRFDGPPLPALAGLDPEAPVAYVGTFSKVLTPALRTGYLVAPPALRARIERLKPITDYHSPWPVQLALAAYLRDGHLDRHVRRMRRHYAANRTALLSGLRPVGDLARPLGLAAGLHACLELRPPLVAARVAAAARQRGVVVATLDGCYEGPPDRQGLLLGYGGLTLDQIERGAAVLAEVVRQEARRVPAGR